MEKLTVSLCTSLLVPGLAFGEVTEIQVMPMRHRKQFQVSTKEAGEKVHFFVDRPEDYVEYRNWAEKESAALLAWWEQEGRKKYGAEE